MKGLALIIGNGTYEQDANNLKNPVNDANDFSEILKRLGYIVNCYTNINQQDLDTKIAEFGKKLDKYDVGIFYFAGHGMQIDGDNFITATNTNFESEISAKYSSITLNKVLAYMEKANSETNIVILDACRDNPFERSWDRSIANQGLAPMYAPKGTMIAYATSPGERAKDGIGNNGLYTTALLKHIEENNVPIEEFFKRVRSSVFAFSNGKQTSWEHTSLTGTFIFNSGQLIHSVDVPYTDKAIADKNFELSNNEVCKIIKELKAHNWYIQSPAIDRIKEITPNECSKDELFVLGRNILQTANGGENQAGFYMNNLNENLEQFNIDGENDVLNGILFEIFFNTDGIFRGKYLKSYYLPVINTLSSNPDYKPSFEFIENQLSTFKDNLFYTPSPSEKSVNFDVIFEKIEKDGIPIYRVKDILFEIKSVLVKETDSYFNTGDETYYETMQFLGLKKKISDLSFVPLNRLSVTTNFDNEISDFSKIDFPIGYEIKKNN